MTRRAGCATTRTTAICSRGRRTSGCISSFREWGWGVGDKAVRNFVFGFYYSPLPTPHTPTSIWIACIEEHFPCAVLLFFPDGHVRSFVRFAAEDGVVAAPRVAEISAA